MLLKTKFIKPQINPNRVKRERLIERLSPIPGRKMILITAPAGYGKTTLVLDRVVDESAHYHWLSLDRADNDSDRFWHYLVAAIDPNLIRGKLETDNAHEMIATIINAISVLEHQHCLVLDDFHHIQDTRILSDFSYFIEFLPPHIELILTSRYEPQLPIGLWKIKNWLVQISARELAFTETESDLFFRQYMGLELSESQLRSLTDATEGWAAAMQLSALSIQTGLSASDANSLPDLSSNADHQLNDYVLNEIVREQSNELSDFIESTIYLTKFSAPLVDSIRGNDDSHQHIQSLLQRNLFLIPLDDKGLWYRYHETFRDALRNQIQQTSPEASQLLKKAIDWHKEHQQSFEAIEYAVDLKDWDFFAALAEEFGNNLIHEGQHLDVLRWLQLMPQDDLYASPQLQMLHIWALFFCNKIDLIAPLLDQLENSLKLLENDESYKALSNEISLIRSYLARSESDLDKAGEITESVLRELDTSQMPLKSVTYYGIGLDCFSRGDFNQATESLNAAIRIGKSERKYTTVLSSSGLLGWIYYYQGKVEEALELGWNAQKWIDSYHDPAQPRIISCWQNCAMALLYTERGELTTAETYVLPLQKHLELGTEPGQHVLIQYVKANLLMVSGKLDEAIDCLNDAIVLLTHKRDAIVFEPPSCSALKLQCLIAKQDYASARRFLLELDDKTITRMPLHFEDFSLSRIRLLQSEKQFAFSLICIRYLLPKIKEQGHTHHLVQALYLKAQALLFSGETEKAAKIAEECFQTAASASYCALFKHEPHLAKVLACVTQAAIPKHYLESISQFLTPQASSIQKPVISTDDKVLTSLLEPLSQRELEVLGLINLGLANKEIASKLFLAPATIKAHIRNIYGKLAAKSRTEALSKARQAGLL